MARRYSTKISLMLVRQKNGEWFAKASMGEIAMGSGHGKNARAASGMALFDLSADLQNKRGRVREQAGSTWHNPIPALVVGAVEAAPYVAAVAPYVVNGAGRAWKAGKRYFSRRKARRRRESRS
jgi:hypothetical protein